MTTGADVMLAGRKWFACDTHVHTSFSSDCWTPPEEVVRAAKKRGLGLIAITDHHDVRDGARRGRRA